MPEHPKTMWGVVEDVRLGPSVLACSAALSEFAFQHRECRVLTCDGTVKIALALNWNERNIFRTSAAKAHMVWRPEEMVSRVFTVLGTAGFVLGAVPMKDEAACIVTHTFDSLGEDHSLYGVHVR